MTQLNEQDTEVVFTSQGTVNEALFATNDPDLMRELSNSRWNPGEFRINAPSIVIDHNGDEIQGRIVIWNLDGDQPDEFRVVFTTEEPPLRWWWVVASGVIFTTVLGMMLTLESPPKRKTRKAKPAKAHTSPAETDTDD